MLKKSNLALKSPALRLAFSPHTITNLFMFFKNLFFSHYNLFGVGVKAVVFSLALAGFYNYRSFWSFFLFIALALYFYFKSFFEAGRYFFSFLIFLIVSLSAIYWLPNNVGKWNLIAAAVFGIVFFAFLGIKNLIFINRPFTYEFINNFLFFSVFIIFFLSDKSSTWFFFEYAAVFLAFFLLFREFIFSQETRGLILPFSLPAQAGAKINLFSASFSFLVSQFVLTAAYLPIGFLNSAAISLAIVLVIKDLTASHLLGILNQRIILKNATILLIFSVIVFIASEWQP